MLAPLDKFLLSDTLSLALSQSLLVNDKCPISPLECAFTSHHRVLPGFGRNCLLASPLECALTKRAPLNSFRMRSSEKNRGEVPIRKRTGRNACATGSQGGHEKRGTLSSGSSRFDNSEQAWDITGKDLNPPSLFPPETKFDAKISISGEWEEIQKHRFG